MSRWAATFLVWDQDGNEQEVDVEFDVDFDGDVASAQGKSVPWPLWGA